jgi:hypothetical protein
MYRKVACCLALILLPAAVLGQEPAKPPDAGDESEKVLSGMSIVGNDEAPKSLVIVPWKSSELGDTLDVLRALDDGRRPVDRDVFMRALTYYEIRAGHRGDPGSDTQ